MEILKEKYTITELSEMLQVTDHTLRFYEKELELNIPKDDRGRRFYTANLANMMYKIKVMRSEGLEIKAIKKIMQEDSMFEQTKELQNENSVSLMPSTSKDSEALQVFFHEFGKQLSQEITLEIMDAKDHLVREIAKSKLELGACVENGMRKLEGKMDKHYEEVDVAIGKWREKSKKRPLKKLFSIIHKSRI